MVLRHGHDKTTGTQANQDSPRPKHHFSRVNLPVRTASMPSITPVPDPTGGMQNGFDPRTASGLSAHERAMVERRQRLLGPAYKLMYQHPVELVRGEGVHLYDCEGRAYLDCYNNVVSVGHCNPHVVQAVATQLGTLNTHTRYMNDQILEYAERLLATFDRDSALRSGRVMFACTGSEANDLAVRMLKHYTGGTGIIVTDNAYHGTTELIASLSPSMGAGTPLHPHARTVPAPDTYRCPHRQGQDADTEVGAKFAADVEAAIVDMHKHGIKFAGLLVDTIFSSDGLFPTCGMGAGAGFLQPAVDVVHKNGGLFIADEVQPGFGRTGRNVWGFQAHAGVRPDLVTMGKPMGNGVPVAACVARADVADTFGRDVRYFNTFGGNPVSITAASATLDEVLRLMPQAAQVGAHTLAGLTALQAKYPAYIGDVRGAGQYFAVAFVRGPAADAKFTTETSSPGPFHELNPDPALASRVVNHMREHSRVLISTTSKAGNSLKIRPLLAFQQHHADQLLAALDCAIEASVHHLEGSASTTQGQVQAETTTTQGDGGGSGGRNVESVLEATRTPVTESQAQEVLAEHFGIVAAQPIKRLIGERDDNFRVTTADGKQFTIKFVHPAEPREMTAFQTAILHHLRTVAPNLPVAQVIDPLPSSLPSPLPAPNVPTQPAAGRDSEGQLLYDGRVVRVVTFLEGEVLAAAPRTPQQAYNIGRTGAQLTLALQSFTHPGQGHELLWDTTHVSQMRRYLDALPLASQREVVEGLIVNYEQRVAPHVQRGELDIQVIHNDLNAANVLVHPHAPDDVAGVIDWYVCPSAPAPAPAPAPTPAPLPAPALQLLHRPPCSQRCQRPRTCRLTDRLTDGLTCFCVCKQGRLSPCTRRTGCGGWGRVQPRRARQGRRLA